MFNIIIITIWNSGNCIAFNRSIPQFNKFIHNQNIAIQIDNFINISRQNFRKIQTIISSKRSSYMIYLKIQTNWKMFENLIADKIEMNCLLITGSYGSDRIQ